MSTGYALWMLSWVLWREADRCDDRWDRWLARFAAITLAIEAVTTLVEHLAGVDRLADLWR